MEEALFLSQFAERIRLIEFLPQLKASAHLQERARANQKFAIHTNTEVVEFRRGSNGRLAALVARDRATGEIGTFSSPAAAFVFVGLHPNTAFVRETVELNGSGFIVSDDAFRTSMPGVFAAGDVRTDAPRRRWERVTLGAGEERMRRSGRRRSRLRRRRPAVSRCPRGRVRRRRRTPPRAPSLAAPT